MRALEQPGKESKRGRFSVRTAAALALVAAGLFLIAAGVKSLLPPAVRPAEPVEPVPVESRAEEASPFVMDEAYLKDKLYITRERAGYESGQMVLKIPRMGVDVGVQAGVTDEYMDVGPGLFDYSQLPGGGDRNVSVCGHRDIKGSHFYFIHKLTAGDLFYLVYDDVIYQYIYKDTKIVEPTDWGPIYGQGFPCLTIVTCNPIGSTRERIVVRAELVGAAPYAKNFEFKPWEDGLEKPYCWERSAKSWDADLPEEPDAPAREGAASPAP